VPSGTDVRALVARFQTTGVRVTVGGVTQVSGTTPHNFATAVAYSVSAADGTTQIYTVSVTVAAASANDITGFRFLSADNAGLRVDVSATISGSSIVATVPVGTTLTELVATFTTTGTSVQVAGVAQVSGTTANDFARPVSYRVTAADGSTRDYTVIVTVAAATTKAISDFRFLSAHNPVLRVDVSATINGAAIAVTVPSGTNVSTLVATFTTTGVGVTVREAGQISGATANDFTAPVTYRVTAADGSTRDYTVTVTVAPRNAKAITDFRFLSALNPGLAADVLGTISGTSISVVVASGSDVSALVATFSTTGTAVTVAGVAQVSGVTPHSFATPLVYRVSAADATTQNYTVTVTVAPRTAKAITSYAFLSAHNPGLSADVRAVIAGTTIAATFPEGADVTALVATFSTTGTSVTVGDAGQISGITPNSFASQVVYRVTAADGSRQDYTVVVTVPSRLPKELTDFRFLAANNPGLGTSFVTTGVTVTVAQRTQTSGVTPNNFTSSVIYRVLANDESGVDYTVSVTAASGAGKAITAYRFLAEVNPGLPANVIGRFDGTDIFMDVPVGINLASLIAMFTTTGNIVFVGAVQQVSSTTPNRFSLTEPLVYRVFATDETSQEYRVHIQNAGTLTAP
jgi:hypothetical protein